jgi:hypothetical protein
MNYEKPEIKRRGSLSRLVRGSGDFGQDGSDQGGSF